MKLPRMRRSGAMPAAVWNRFCDIIEAHQFTAGNGIRFGQQTPHGRAIHSTAVGASVVAQPFQLFVRTVEEEQRIGVTPSTLHDVEPSAGTDWTLDPVGTSGVVWARVTDNSSYVVTARAIECGETMPANEEHIGYVQLGTYVITTGSLSVTNDRYGPIHHINCGATEHFWA